MNRSLCQKLVLPDMHSEMSTETKNEVLARLRRRYVTAGAEHKAKLLDQAVELLGYHRKAAIRALRQAPSREGPGASTWCWVGPRRITRRACCRS